MRLQPGLGCTPSKRSIEAMHARQWETDVQHGGGLPCRPANGTLHDPRLVDGRRER